MEASEPNLHHYFPGDSEVAKIMRSFDWTSTDLGAPQHWPPNLGIAVALCLTSRFPMQIWWGPRLTLLYNDATVSLLGARKHPRMLGRSAHEAWQEISHLAIPLAEAILSGEKEATWCEDLPLFLNRHVANEEVYLTLSFSPIYAAQGGVDGIFCACTETTERVIATRRLETLRRLGVKPAQARSALAACKEAVAVLADNPLDIPFAAIYLTDNTDSCSNLCATTGVGDAHKLPTTISPSDQDAPWHLAKVLRDRCARDVDLTGCGVTDEFWHEPVTTAIAIPVSGWIPGELAGVIVAAVSPRQMLNEAYRRFLQSVVQHIETVIFEARAYDIEQRKGETLSSELRQSGTRYQALFDSMHEAVVMSEAVLDASGEVVDFRIQEVNAAFEALTGLSGAVGKTMRELGPVMEPMCIENLAKITRTGRAILTERYVAMLDRWFEVRVLRPGGDGSLRLLCFIRNITKRKRAEEETRALFQRLSTLMDNSPLAVIELNSELRITRWSAHAERVFGWSAAEAVGLHLNDLPIVHETDRAQVDEIMERLRDPADTFVLNRNRNNTKQGKVITCEWYNSVIHDERGNLVAVLALALEVTERERSEAALRESEARSAAKKEAFQLAISGAPVVDSLNVLLRIAVHQLGGDARAAFFVVCSDQMRLCAVTGATSMPDTFIQSVDKFPIGPDLPACGSAAYYGQPVTTTDVEFDPRWSPFLLAARQADVRGCWSFPMKTLGGRVLGTLAVFFREPRAATPRDHEIVAPVTDAAAIIVSRFNETEERKAAEAALRDDDRRKDEFLATLAHELRNPLAPIRAAADVMRLAEDDAVVSARAREIIDRQLRNLARLVDDLLDVSRITRDKIELRRERLALSNAVESAVETSRPLLDARGHSLAVNLPPSEIWLHADPVRMTQVITNLLNNAARYTEGGGHITLSVEQQGDEAVIRVRDDGIGIPADKLPRIFDMFTQVDSGRGQLGGLGLGLTIVRRLVEMHGGRVTAASEGVGRGSEFTVRLPVSAVEHVENKSSQRLPPVSLPAHRILVVDDNRDAADSLKLLFEITGNEVHVAYDGRTALEEAHRFRPSLLFVDIGMPGMSGYEVARKLREDSSLSDMLLVAVTGWGGGQEMQRSRKEGFDVHLTKPVDLEALQGLLRDHSRRGSAVTM